MAALLPRGCHTTRACARGYAVSTGRTGADRHAHHGPLAKPARRPRHSLRRPDLRGKPAAQEAVNRGRRVSGCGTVADDDSTGSISRTWNQFAAKSVVKTGDTPSRQPGSQSATLMRPGEAGWSGRGNDGKVTTTVTARGDDTSQHRRYTIPIAGPRAHLPGKSRSRRRRLLSQHFRQRALCSPARRRPTSISSKGRPNWPRRRRNYALLHLIAHART